LTYLWQRSRKELLEEMISRGIEAILVKVAGAGLDPEKHLGTTLSSLTHLHLNLRENIGNSLSNN
jgi:diphthine-ammonia ligase